MGQLLWVGGWVVTYTGRPILRQPARELIMVPLTGDVGMEGDSRIEIKDSESLIKTCLAVLIQHC